MSISPLVLWIAGGLIVIVVVIIVAKSGTVSFDWKKFKLSFDKNKEQKDKSNTLTVKGNKNITQQDVNNPTFTSKDNKMTVEGDENKTEQDVNNK
ncbi:MAG TPA: hypothetical protein PKW80_07370 [Bacteroidales bacterium]|nr:hypothetical protein [Bacteroidales bacterium]